MADWVPSSTARKLIRQHLDAGHTIHSAAKTCGIPPATLYKILRDTPLVVNAATVERLEKGLGERPKMVSSKIVGQQIRALRALGWQLKELGDRLGISPSTVSSLSEDRNARVSRHIADIVRIFYREHAGVRVGPARGEARFWEPFTEEDHHAAAV